MSLKDSGKCLVPPSNPATLEAKVDDLHFKVDQLLTRTLGRWCPLCGTCAHHSTLQETVTGQLSAQTRLLDSLERKVLEMRTALEDLACGLEDRLCERVSVPLVALQRRKSLPVRTSAEEVYVCLDTPRDRKIVSHALNVASEKGILLEVNENNGIKGEGNLTKDSSEVKIQHEVKSQNKGEKETSKSSHDHQKTLDAIKMEHKNNIKTPTVAPPVSLVNQRLIAPRSPSPKPEVQNEKKLPPPNPKVTKMTTTAPVTAAVALSGTIVPKHFGAVNEIQPENHTIPKKTEPVFPKTTKTASGTSTVVINSSPKLTLPDVSTASSPGHNPPKSNLVFPAQSFGKSPESTEKTKMAQHSTLFPPSHKPPKTMGLTVTTATKEASLLRQVQSCPNSLQRLQVTAGKKDTPLTSPLEKRGTVSSESKHLAGGIQIKISPAVDKPPAQTKVNSPPKTCLKIIDDAPPQPATFSHRFVALKSNPPPCDTFSIHSSEVLGGGRFGKVHKCTENKTGMRLAAKIISTRNAKERDMALNEIQVMNQLSHSNILQLYEAFEVKNQVVLILEYVEGGELFERIVDESCQLTEVDAMVFVKQICEGVQYMHQMYVLHLDLKPENILLVNHSSHQVKIIDFGLARRYKPREKLKVSFGTPEFLAPEVVNFDFVSFPTDMWTLGVVTYMLLSGLSPFLGDDDSQTLNNVLMCNWYFDEDAFEHVSTEAREFVSNLLIRERSGRLSAAQCLKHPWLNNISEKAKSSNIVLKSQVLLKKYMARRMWKKNYIAIAAANRFKKIGSSGSLTSLAI